MSCLFQVLEATHIPEVMIPFHLQSQPWPVRSFSFRITPTLTLLPPSATFRKDPVLALDPSS